LETPVRTGNLRDPNGPQSTFAAESFIDELAAAANADPFEFRMKLLTASTDDDRTFRRARSIACSRPPPTLTVGIAVLHRKHAAPERSSPDEV